MKTDWYDKPVMDGYSRRQLGAAFCMVGDPREPLRSIRAAVDPHFRQVVRAAIRWHTGCEPEFHYNGDGMLEVECTIHWRPVPIVA